MVGSCLDKSDEMTPPGWTNVTIKQEAKESLDRLQILMIQRTGKMLTRSETIQEAERLLREE